MISFSMNLLWGPPLVVSLRRALFAERACFLLRWTEYKVNPTSALLLTPTPSTAISSRSRIPQLHIASLDLVRKKAMFQPLTLIVAVSLAQTAFSMPTVPIGQRDIVALQKRAVTNLPTSLITCRMYTQISSTSIMNHS